MVQNWTEITIFALQNLWQRFLDFLPNLLGAIVVFGIGWFFAHWIGKLVSTILSRLKFNKFFERTGWKEALEKAEITLNPAEFVGGICKWILVIVFLSVAVEILGFFQFAEFLNKVVSWLPNLVVAVAIFVVAVILADILEKVAKAWVRKMGLKGADFLGEIVKGAIYIFATLSILLQLGVTPTLINTLIIGFVGMIALAFGLAFGLGGKETAAKLIEELRRKISESK